MPRPEMTNQEQIKELESKIAAVCMRCPRVKWLYGSVKCRSNRRHCHSSRVRRWLDEIRKLEGG